MTKHQRWLQLHWTLKKLNLYCGLKVKSIFKFKVWFNIDSSLEVIDWTIHWIFFSIHDQTLRLQYWFNIKVNSDLQVKSVLKSQCLIMNAEKNQIYGIIQKWLLKSLFSYYFSIGSILYACWKATSWRE